MMAEHLTDRQKKWMATVEANFEAKTGRSLAAWAAIARACPETAHRKRLEWLREHHGLGVNHGAFVLSKAFPEEGPGWDDPAALRGALWKHPGSLAILETIERAAEELEALVIGHRKSFTAFSRDVQFAAARPLKGGGALLALKLDPAVSPRLSPVTRKESWSERLTAQVEFASAGEVDGEIAALLREAHGNG